MDFLPELKIKNYMYIIFGIGVGLLSFFSPGSLFMLFLIVISVLFINRIPDKKERNFVLGLFLAAFGTRVFFTLSTMLWAIFNGDIYRLRYPISSLVVSPLYYTPEIIDDSGFYTLRSLFISMHWLGKPMSKIAVGGAYMTYGFTGFLYILATFFALFGYSPISSRFINCFLGSLIIILVYSIVKNIFGEKPARISAILTAFFPSLFLWSITNTKDTTVIFMAYVMLWSIIKFKMTRKIYYLIIALLSMWFQFFIRSAYIEFLYLNIAIALFYFFYLFVLNLYNRKKIIFLLIIFMIGGSIFFFERSKVNSVFEDIRQKALMAHAGALSEGGICYKLLPERFYKTGKLSHIDFLKMLGNGWLHIMLEPFPWNIKSKSMLISFPQMILRYLLIIFAILGMFVSVRYRLKEASILFIHFFVITSALAVTGGNIGTIFRLRDIVTPIILMFSSVGLINTFSSVGLQSVDPGYHRLMIRWNKWIKTTER